MTNPKSTEEKCEYGLPSGTCFTASRFEVVAVAGLLWTYFVVFFFSVWWDFVFLFSFFLLRTLTGYFKYEATLPHVPLYLYKFKRCLAKTKWTTMASRKTYLKSEECKQAPIVIVLFSQRQSPNRA